MCIENAGDELMQHDSKKKLANLLVFENYFWQIKRLNKKKKGIGKLSPAKFVGLKDFSSFRVSLINMKLV